MMNNKWLIGLLLCLVTCNSCEDWNFRPNQLLAEAITGSVNLTNNRLNISLIGNIKPKEEAKILDYGYLYGKSEWPTQHPDSVISLYQIQHNVPINIEETIIGLPINSIYYFQIYVKFEDRTVYGDVMPIATNVISITNEAPEVIDQNTTFFTGTVLGLHPGSFSLIEHGHCWSSVTPEPFIDDPSSDSTKLGARLDNGIFQSQISGLQEKEFYYIRSYGVYESLDGLQTTVYSTPVSFQIGDFWIEKGNIEQVGRFGSFAFVHQNEIYLGAGFQRLVTLNSTPTNFPVNSFIKYDPVMDKWTPQGELPWANRIDAITFTLDTHGAYIGLGYNPINSSYHEDLWQFKQGQWKRIEMDFSIEGRRGAISFSHQNRGYIGLGINSSGQLLSDIRELESNSDSTIVSRKEFNIPAALRRTDASTFVIEDTVYIAFGRNASGQLQNDIIAFTPNVEPHFRLLSSCPDHDIPNKRIGAVAFALNGKGYLGTGLDESNNSLADFWEFNPSSPCNWRELPGLPGQIRYKGIAIVYDGDAYVGTGQTKVGSIGYEFSLNDWYRYIVPE